MEQLKKEDYIHGGLQKDFYEEHEREECPCLLCGSADRELLDTERGLGVVQCRQCGLIYVSPRAKGAQENYFGDPSVYYSEARLIFKGKKVHHRDRNYLYELGEIKKVKPKGRLLDVGTNMGFFLRKAREVGFETEGVEPSPSVSQIARENWGLKIHTAFLEEANLPKHHYDVITLIDVFEHVTNPRQLLSTCSDLLADKGIIAIKVPNGDYNHFKMKLGKWTGKGKTMNIWDACEHVGHYTPQTFSKMAEGCGFKVKRSLIPLPIHPPVWANLVGHYYQYPSPFILDWKRIVLRNIFYYLGKIEFALFNKTRFGPDLMFIIEKK